MTLTDSDTEEDQRIIAAIKDGNQIAFSELYDKHSTWLMALAYRILGDKGHSEDLLHDVFLEIWHKANTYNSERGSLKSWLAVKTRSRALDRLRALNTINKHTGTELTSPIELSISANDASLTNDHIKAKKLMQKLSLMQRTVIELSYFRGYTCQEIADYCQLPLGTVKSGIQRGIRLLRKELVKNEDSTHVN